MLALVGREETGLGRCADLVLDGPIGDTLGGAVRVNRICYVQVT